jgi:hypothetical protein
MPHLSMAKLAIQAARGLTFDLRNPEHTAPFANVGHQQHGSLAILANMPSHARTLQDPSKPITNAFQKVFFDVMQGTVVAFTRK